MPAEPTTQTTNSPSTATAAATRAPARVARGGSNAPRRPGPAGRGFEEEKQFDERTLHLDRVARVVKGGRRFRFRALVVVGDHKGRVGIGIAKGADVTAAVTKATEVAKKHFINVPLNGDTIPHEVETKVGGAKILLKPASPGTGLIAGGVVRAVLEVAGVKNALSKSLGSTNKHNTAYATLEGLQQLKPAREWLTRQNKSKPAKTAKQAKAIDAPSSPVKKPASKAAKKAK